MNAGRSIARIATWGFLASLVLAPNLYGPILAQFTENGAPAVYNQGSLFDLTVAHLVLVVVSSAIAAFLAIGAGVFVTRPSGRDFLPLSRSIVNIGQTFPPVAVLALSVPAIGFGVKPTLVALTLYGLLPIFENTIAGLRQTPEAVLEAAAGAGLSSLQRLLQIEIPLALPIILAGVRLSVVVNLGTATIGSTVAAKGLGEVIIAGLQTSNTAFVLQGGVIVALLAIVIYDSFGLAERALARQTGLQ